MRRAMFAATLIALFAGVAVAQTARSRPDNPFRQKATTEEKEAAQAVAVGGTVFIGAAVCVGALFYFLPLFIAMVRGHSHQAAIAFVNLLLGWTLLGWVAALIWSFVDTPKQQYRRRYAED